MAKKKNGSGSDDSYRNHADSINAGQIGNFYIYHGDERYLLEYCLGVLRSKLCPDGAGGFNYKRYEGKAVSIDELDDAINTLPVFTERTLIELHDFDIFSNAEKPRLAEIFSDLPYYICIVIVFDTLAYKPDGRQKTDKEIVKRAQVVEFCAQGRDMLVKWIIRHFKEYGKTITVSDAEYLVHITGGYMSAIQGEIGKTAAYAAGDTVSRADIDAVVTPVLDAVVYKLTDAIVQREYSGAMRILDELLRMREAPQMIIFSVSLKMRQFLAARVCIESSSGTGTLIELCGIRYEFQAKMLMDTARKTTLAGCREAVLICAETANAINSAPEPEARLTEMIIKLADALKG